ncbi:MAG: hypothetical protein QW282_06155 [Nitrososphaerales archaeon]
MGLLKRLSRFRSAEFYVPYVLIVLCVLTAKFLKSDVVFGVFLATLLVYVLRRYDSRLLVGMFMLLLVVCASLLAMGYSSYANDVAVWAYYFLVIGVLGLLAEYVREEKRRRDAQQA